MIAGNCVLPLPKSDTGNPNSLVSPQPPEEPRSIEEALESPRTALLTHPGFLPLSQSAEGSLLPFWLTLEF